MLASQQTDAQNDNTVEFWLLSKQALFSLPIIFGRGDDMTSDESLVDVDRLSGSDSDAPDALMLLTPPLRLRPSETPSKKIRKKTQTAKASPKKAVSRKPVKKSPKATKKTQAGKDGQRKAKTGEKYCIGCKKFFPLAEFPDSKALCGADARAWRNICNQAATQEDKDYLAETKRDEEKFQRMLANYHTRCALPDGKRNKRMGFSLMSFKEWGD